MEHPQALLEIPSKSAMICNKAYEVLPLPGCCREIAARISRDRRMGTLLTDVILSIKGSLLSGLLVAQHLCLIPQRFHRCRGGFVSIRAKALACTQPGKTLTLAARMIMACMPREEPGQDSAISAPSALPK